MSTDIVIGKTEKQKARRIIKEFFQWRNRPDAYEKFLENTREKGRTFILLATVYQFLRNHPRPRKKNEKEFDVFMHYLKEAITLEDVSFSWRDSPEGGDYWVKTFYY